MLLYMHPFLCIGLCLKSSLKIEVVNLKFVLKLNRDNSKLNKNITLQKEEKKNYYKHSILPWIILFNEANELYHK